MNELKEKSNILKQGIMSIYGITNINSVNIDVDRLYIEINLPTNSDIINNFMEMSRIISVDLKTLIFKETVSLFNVINNQVDINETELFANNTTAKNRQFISLVKKFVSLVDISDEKSYEEYDETINSDFEHISSRKREHKNEEIERQKNRKAGLLRKEFLSGTGKFSDKTNDNKNEY